MRCKALVELVLLVTIAVTKATWGETGLFRRDVIVGEEVWRCDFDSADGWTALHHCVITTDGGLLHIRAMGSDPYFAGPPMEIPGPAIVKLRMRSDMTGSGEIFWKTASDDQFRAGREVAFTVPADKAFHEASVFLDESDKITGLRIDPPAADGTAEIDWIEIDSARRHPLEIVDFRSSDSGVTLSVKNHHHTLIAARVDGIALDLPPEAVTQVIVAGDPKKVFELKHVQIEASGVPSISRDVCLHRPSATLDAQTIGAGDLKVEIARDGLGARIRRRGKIIAIIAPLVVRNGQVPRLKLAETTGRSAELRGQGITCRLSVDAEQLRIHIESDQTCEGPALRAVGRLKQGVFAGLEYLSAGERSSSTLDIETESHWREQPNLIELTMPLMAFVTDEVAAAVSWHDMRLQPTYATPNFFDGADDHRMSLKGKTIEATLLLAKPEPIEEVILWGVRQAGGLPNLPKPPRTRQQSNALAMQALNGALRNADGWGHCVEENWQRQPYADIASTVFRLTGRVEPLPKLVSGGSIRNDAIYFLTGRAELWLDERRREVRELMAEQKPDGSWRYNGPYQRGHYEDTASGYCAPKALRILEYARCTGDTQAREAGLRALAYMKRFDAPRGAQTWEVPLHTPDILASAYLVDAYVAGYEMTGDQSHLKEARRWALSGVPFVYQWSRYPVMAYSTVAVFGASNWRAPVWIGMPVQWCGLTFAHALVHFAPYDATLDWKTLARGILIAAEQMQFPQGREAGCLPDSWVLDGQDRNGPAINPCAIVTLQEELAGEVASLSVVQNDNHIVVAPFAVQITGDAARIQGRKGLRYQVLLDGERIVDVTSRGIDQIQLSAPH